MKYSEKWGDSIDGAVELALQDLKLTRDQVTVTVLEEPSKGFFGIGSKLAKVRVEEIKPEKPAREEKPVQKKQEKPAVKAEAPKSEKPANKGNKPKPAKAKAEKPAQTRRSIEEDFDFEDTKVLGERPADLKETADHPAKTFLEDVVAKMGLNVSIKVMTNESNVYADIEGPDCGTIIGKRGQTLDSIQYLTSLVVNKEDGAYKRVVVDAEGYRQKREKTLEKLAVRMADKALKSGKSVRLEPMNPYERKVIHTTLQKVEGVNTRSEGEEPYRRVVIEAVK